MTDADARVRQRLRDGGAANPHEVLGHRLPPGLDRRRRRRARRAVVAKDQRDMADRFRRDRSAGAQREVVFLGAVEPVAQPADPRNEVA